MAARCDSAYHRSVQAPIRRVESDVSSLGDTSQLLLAYLREAAGRLSDPGAAGPVSKPSAFTAEPIVQGVIARFREITGATLRVPAAA